MTSFSLSAAESPAPSPLKITPPEKLEKPVLTPKNVKVNKTQPRVSPPTGEVKFSETPTTLEITRARVLPDALVPSGKTNPAENKELARSLIAVGKSESGNDVSPLNSFLQNHPDSVWAVSLEMNLGLEAYERGYFSRAMVLWESAWKNGEDLKDPATRAQVDRAFGELVRMHARIGNIERLKELFAELGDRSLTGSATELVANAREGLWMMENTPEIAFRCGPFALGAIFHFLNPEVPVPGTVEKSISTKKGFALTEVDALAKNLKLNYQMAFWKDRSAGSLPPLPALIHWKVGHYAALLREEEGRFLVKDSTFGKDLWIDKEALMSEASGYFLISAKSLPEGWTKVSADEGNTIFGKGATTNKQPGALTPDDPQSPTCPHPAKASTPSSKGMAQAGAHLMLVSLHIEDNPLNYAPPKGPAVNFTVGYNQRDISQPSIFSYSNLGVKWTFDWLSYVVDDPSNVSADVEIYAKGGGTYPFKNFHSATQLFDIQLRNQGLLKRTGTNSYECNFPDGSKQIYGLSDGSAGSGRRVFLTEERDPLGNGLVYTYDSLFRLTNVTDAVGQVTTLSYTLPADSLKITKVTDPFGRYSTLEYDSSGRLKKITDVVGITSEFTYGTDDFITSLTTPYGTETYDTGGTGTTRWLNMTDPQGDTRRVEYRHEAPGIPIYDPASVFPTGLNLTNDSLQYRNSFYWDKKAWKLYPGDYTKAQITHFCHVYGDVNTTSGTIESTKAPFENRVWYVYPFSYNGDTRFEGRSGQPILITKKLDPTTIQSTQFTYNAQGNVTEKIDPLNRRTDFAYAANGIDLLSVNQTTGSMNEFLGSVTYNSLHEPLTVTDASGQTTTYTYNSAGQLLTAQNAKGEVTTLTYDTNGFLTQIDPPASGSSDKTSFTYDGFNRVRTVTDSEGYVKTYDYDALNRPTKVTFPDSTFEQVVYNRLNPEWIKDRQNRWTHNFFNSIQQRVAVQDSMGQTTNFEWCKCGALQGLTDPMGRVTKWKYDIQGRLLEKTYPDGTKITYSYEPVTSRLMSVVDAKSQRINYEYFVDDQLKRVSYTDLSGNPLSPVTPDVQWTYDASYGRLASMVDVIGTTTYSYNAITSTPAIGGGRLASVDGPVSGTGDLIAFSYDELGRLSQRSINSVTQSLQYDNLGRMTNISNPLGAFVYHYLNYTNRLSSIDLPNGQKTQFNYFNNAGDQRLEEIKNLDAQSTPGIISKFNYTYAPEGNILTWRQEYAGGASDARQYDLRYDASDQLLEGTLKNVTTSAILKNNLYRYDKAGNRTSEQIDLGVTSSTNNNLNQVTSISGGIGAVEFSGTVSEPSTVTVGGAPAQVDAAGNFRGTVNLAAGTGTVPVVATDASGNVKTQNYQVTVPGGGTRTLTYDLNGNLTNDGNGKTYAWDAANRMVKITYGSSGSSEFTYDGLGRRVKIVEKDGSGTVTSDKRFLWDGMEICEERDSSGTVTKRYYGQGMAQGSSASPAATDKFYYTRDHLGSIRELTTSTGATQSAYDYDLYGRQDSSLPAGMKIWLKADAGVTKDGSNKVSAWADQSGNGNNASQATSAAQPTCVSGALNGQAVIRFGGIDDVLNGTMNFNPGSSDHSMFVVHKRSTPSNASAPFSFAGNYSTPDYGAPVMTWIDSGNQFGTTNNYNGWTDAKYVDISAESGSYHISSISRRGGTGGNGGALDIRSIADSTLYETLATQNWASTTSGYYLVGSHNTDPTSPGEHLIGDVAEVIVYDRALTPSERTRVETYLARKYARREVQADFRYTGHYYHERSGLSLAPYRAYDAELNRWLSRDPIAESGGINLYGYVGNDPINEFDPLGLWATGINFELSTINPFTSGGGGSYGLNLEYTSCDGLHLYRYYTPDNGNSFGFLPGPSLTVNGALGTGDWTGLFDNVNVSLDIFTGGAFKSNPDGYPDNGYRGVSFGLGKGPPGFGGTTTNYKKIK